MTGLRASPAFVASMLLGFGLLTAPPAVADDTLRSDPRAVRIVTTDIPRFWAAYDAAQTAPDPAHVYAAQYFAPGTDGLKGFIPYRLQSPQHLADVVQRQKAFYAQARDATMRIAAARERIQADLVRYKQVVPDAVFPDIYFVIGALNSAGTSVSGVGLVIGAEMFARPADPAATLKDFNWHVLETPDAVPSLITHELTHYNQHDADANTLLAGVIVEGTADFVAQLVSGDRASMVADQWAFGCAHEDALWQAFVPVMGSEDKSGWLYGFGAGPLGGPPFMGYWLGSRIAQAYYDSHVDKIAAVHAILNVSDYAAFVKASGYPEHRPPCVPEQRYHE
jgi:hypothetical protein